MRPRWLRDWSMREAISAHTHDLVEIQLIVRIHYEDASRTYSVAVFFPWAKVSQDFFGEDRGAAVKFFDKLVRELDLKSGV